MSILVGLHHVTTYRYDRPVSLGPQVIRLRPAPHSRTSIRSYALKVLPGGHFINWQQDPHGNWLARLVFPEKTTEFIVAVDFVACIQKANPFDFFVESYAEQFPFAYPDELRTDLAACLAGEPAGRLLHAFLGGLPGGPIRTVDFLVALNQKLHQQIHYVTRMEAGVQTAEETLETGSGSCRDMAWLFVQILRRLGIPARFVSGYLIQLRPDEAALDGPSGIDRDTTDLHAWTEAYIPGAGWIGLDPTSGYLAGEGHIALAATPHYRSAAPITGVVDVQAIDFSFEMRVTRIAEQPRVTYPFSDAAWQALDALGDKVDAGLGDDVRLTMGGEPTFVSVDDYESAEWNTAALGPSKRIRAGDLIRRLRDRFAPNGLLHESQGKWYPGEPLPRWALSLFWRRDGLPLWRDQALIAPEGEDLGAGTEHAQRFAQGIAARLGIGSDHIIAAYEDPMRRMLEESEWPDNIDPANPQLDDPAERGRIVRDFNRRLTVPAGFVLPVQAQHAADGRTTWRTEIWPLRRGRLFLIPGDSPLGLRLPLHALPYLPRAGHPVVIPADPFMPRDDLPHPDILFQRAEDLAAESRLAEAQADEAGTTATEKARREERHPTVADPVRTALTVEPRDGQLRVFMPPVAALEDY
ncbi:MAG: transglutaminase family protein, partial [Bradyrhizobiaceae bacterium]|nr:transglutaminase family protein [Bradyrhizobiaceae bacterium]